MGKEKNQSQTALILALLSLFFAPNLWAKKTFSVLSYSSMSGKGSLGEFIEREFEKSCNCDLKFVDSGGLSSMLSSLKSRKDRGEKLDAVLGLTAQQVGWGMQQKLVSVAQPFQVSPFAIIVDTKKLPEKSWPKSWGDLGAALKKKLLVPDPRFSNTGEGWLRAIFDQRFISPKDSAKLVKNIYPSWSAAYSAFTKGQAPAVWSFLTSQAYHDCNDKEPGRYKALPLKEGYPFYADFVGLISEIDPLSREFMRLTLSKKVQQQVYLKNWMFPSKAEGLDVPDCYKGLPSINASTSKDIPKKDHDKWVDQWSLL